MQQRRFRPGDVLDDYCPRERRITDHAIVAMIDDHIKQTRCVVCDAEHEYKNGKAPAHRRKKPPVLFAQVLEGLQGPHPAARVAAAPVEAESPEHLASADSGDVMPAMASAESHPPVEEPAKTLAPPPPAPVNDTRSTSDAPAREEGPWRRHLIRAALPRPEGQAPPATRPIPEFTVRQPNSRGHRHGRRRSGGGHQAPGGMQGPMRFGRDQRDPQGQGGHRQHNGRRRRGKKK